MTTYSVNGGTSIPGVESTWHQIPKQKQANGIITFQDYAKNTWNIPNMSMVNYLTLQALSGTTITSLETNDVTDRGSAATYSAGVEVGVVNCQHVGVQAQAVRIEFRVKV